MSTLAPMPIGKEIKRERVEQRYSQRQLAELCGFNQQELSAYESGKRLPNAERLEKIATVLGKEWKLSNP